MTRVEAMTYASLIDRLSAEHVQLLPWTDRILELAAGNGSALPEAVESGMAKVREPLDDHIAQEDTVLFPAYASASGAEGLVAQFEAEHREILALRDQLIAACENRNTKQLCAIAARFSELLGDHMRREDMMLFPSAREALA